MITRRRFLATTASGITVLPFAARADGAAGDVFETPRGPIKVYPISRASFVMETPAGVIFVDPVGDARPYDRFPRPDLILITHEHEDHFDLALINRIFGEATFMFTNPAVDALLPEDLKPFNRPLANGDIGLFDALRVEAVPAYNTTEGRLEYHPQGRDNGYILNFLDFRVYISGDTEDTPEMRGLQDIDLAFVCMNLPFTMDAGAAADAVNTFRPRFVYPYHYRGPDNGIQDPAEFADLLAEGIEARMAPWYG